MIKEILIIFILCLGLKTSAQNKNRLLGILPEYTIINLQILEPLDTILHRAENSPSAILNEPYLLWMRIKDSIISIEATPYNVALLHQFREDTTSQKGFFYYKNQLVILEDFENKTFIFFNNTNKSQEIYYQWNKNFSTLFYDYLSESIVLEYKYKERKILRIIDHIGYPVMRRMLYSVEEGDTWESIAQKCKTSVLDLLDPKSHYYELWLQKVPDEGYMIVLDLEFENKKLKNVTRWR